MLNPKTSEEESLDIFMFRFVKTFDPHDEKCPIKYMPEKPHLRDFNKAFNRVRLLGIPKSRQIHATWWGVGAYCWDTYRHIGRHTLFKSIDKQHAGLGKLMLLWRAKFIHENLPECIRPRINIKRKDYALEYPDTMGHIQAMSMEEDASRSPTVTGVLDDELALQMYGEGGYTSVQPALGTTGRYVALSTYKGLTFFKRLMYDEDNQD